MIGVVSVARSVDIPVLANWLRSFPGVILAAPESIATPKGTSGIKVGGVIYRESLRTPGPMREFTFEVAFNAPGVIENEPALKNALVRPVYWCVALGRSSHGQTGAAPLTSS